MSTEKNVILKMENIKKSFSGVQALNNANLELRGGEVLALMGENGAGKSTLMKILTGIYTKDSGRILYMGNEVAYKNPAQSQEAGIAIVHQELNMMKDLTVAQNLFIGKELKNGIFINDKKMNEEARRIFSILNIDINPSQTIGELTVGRQQMVEIAKVISSNAKVVIFDEPTAALTDSEIEDLFKVINDLRDKGIGIIYISHRMNEIKRISDRVCVMRDGEYINTVDTSTTTKDEIINMMVGRTIFENPKTCSSVKDDAPVVLRCENLCLGNKFKNISFELRKGEILGFSGLMGAGRTEVARALFGADKLDSGKIFINGEEVKISSPIDAVKHGIGYLSEDRKRYGLVVDKTVTDNMLLASVDKFEKGLFIDEKSVHRRVSDYVDLLKVKTPSIEQVLKKLSGGNQQKVVIAKWLIRDSDILIFDEPTRGIDVGAKSEIYNLMNELVANGKSIIMISSELTEILRMSDRIVIMCEGRKTGEISIEEATQERIMTAATNRE